MRGIKVGNFLTYKKSVVCIVCSISEGEGNTKIITGKDYSNKIYQGPSEFWSSVILHPDKLKSFKENIYNNIVTYRMSKTR